MTKAVDAKIGDKENCASCGVEITCGQTRGSPEYPAKNQWQVDGKAHYNYNFTTKTTTCNGVIIEDPKNVRTAEARAYAPKVSVTPEILRQESFSDFDKVYSEAIPKAKAIADNILLSTDDRTKIIEITQRILRDYIHFYTARNL